MVKVQSLEILAILSQVSATIAEGEVLQLMTMQDLSISQECYLKIITNKTAKLFEAACKTGAILGKAAVPQQHALSVYGLSIGRAFQLVDDVLDYSASQQKFGKSIGDDFKEGKVTLPVILAYAQATYDEKNFWDRTMRDLNQNDQDFNQALAYLLKYASLDQTLAEAEKYVKYALEQLECFGDSPIKFALQNLAQHIIHRQV